MRFSGGSSIKDEQPTANANVAVIAAISENCFGIGRLRNASRTIVTSKPEPLGGARAIDSLPLALAAFTRERLEYRCLRFVADDGETIRGLAGRILKAAFTGRNNLAIT